jgi:hypothetical protein
MFILFFDQHYREPRDDGSDKIFLGNIPLAWVDIVSFMIARKLIDEGGTTSTVN